MEKIRFVRAIIFSLAVLLLVSILSLKIGVVTDASTELIIELRLPRVFLALAVGMGLAVAGVVLQVVFSNPLCEPFTLGISSGAALGAVLGMGLGLSIPVFGFLGSSFLGAFVFGSVLYLISLKKRVGPLVLLLTGVMMGFLGSGLVSLWMALVDANGVQSALMWLLGDFSRARLEGAVVSVFFIILLVLFVWLRWRDLDALLLGEDGALIVGANVVKIRRRFLILTSLIVGICVSGAGIIGFVGLVVPHFLRRIYGALNFSLIPLSAIWGGIVLILADTIARSVFKPYELPVGVVMSLIGAPIFIVLLIKHP